MSCLTIGGALIIVSGCASENDIYLEKVNQTSEFLNCEKVFAKSRDSIVQLNDILIQTGTIDTIEEVSVKAAVIHVAGKEIILNGLSASETDGVNIETYAGKAYKMKLSYRVKMLSAGKCYKGKCDIWRGKLHSEIAIEGLDSKL